MFFGPGINKKWTLGINDASGPIACAVPVAVDRLIQEIFVSPFATPPLVEVVNALIKDVD